MNEFLNMGGYAFHIWTSYGLAFVVLVAMVILPMRQKKLLTRRIRKTIRRSKKS
ncbi:MAG: heme exporter protein CcmD [Gammaproteobacteria bacterium]|nr:heme exporter protein CcmD [Gammaproteobacteria bacterium]